MSSHSCPASPNLQRKYLHRQKGKTDLCSHSFSSLQHAVANDPQSENVVKFNVVDNIHAKEVLDQDGNTLLQNSVSHGERSTKSAEFPSPLLQFHGKFSNQHDEGYLSRDVSYVSLKSLDHETSRVSLKSNSDSNWGQLLSCSDLDSAKHDVGRLPSPVMGSNTQAQKSGVTPTCVPPDSSTAHPLPLKITNGTVVMMIARIDILEEEVKQLQSSNDVQLDSSLVKDKSERKRMSCCFPSPSPQLVPKQRRPSGTARVLRRMEKVDEESEHTSKTDSAVARHPKWLNSEKKSKSIDVVIKVTPKKHKMRRCISDVVRGEYYEKEDAPFVELQTSVSNIAREAVSSQSQLGWAMSREDVKSGGQNLSSETTPSEEELKKRLTSQVPKFIKHTNWNYLVPHLVAKGLLDGSNTEKLLSGNRTEHEKGVLFYLTVLPHNGEDAYTTFYKCLQEETEHFGHLSLLKLLQNVK